MTNELKPVGRIVKVQFEDGEIMVGSTLEYDPKSQGFSLFPIDVASNNVRVFVVNAAVRRVSDVKPLSPSRHRERPERANASWLWVALTKNRRILPMNPVPQLPNRSIGGLPCELFHRPQ